MQLTKIEISKYKSIVQPITINFNDNLPLVLIGKNGSGKTNILEALEIIALANANKFFEKADLEYKVYFKLSKEDLNRLLPNDEYDEKKCEVIAYSKGTDNRMKIDRIESDYIVPKLKKAVLDIRETASKLKSSVEIYKKQLYKISHNGDYELPITCYRIEDYKGSTTNYYYLENQVRYFLETVEKSTDDILKVFNDEENALTFMTYGHIYFYKQDIEFKLKYVKPDIPEFEKKFITINEKAIKREITKINKATAKACEDINELIDKIEEQLEIITNGLDLRYEWQEKVENEYFKFISEAQKVVARKCLFLKSENNELLFKKPEYNRRNHSKEVSIIDVYFRQVYQGTDKEQIIESLSKNERLVLTEEAVCDFEKYINASLPKFERGMFEKISVKQNENGEIQIYLHEKTGEEISLNDTSSGRRWYFSYYFMKNILEKDDMFIIDEPASMLHPSAQKEILSELEELSKNGIKVIYSTHSPYLIPKKWNSVNLVAMNNGTELLPFDLSSELVNELRSNSTMDIFWYQEVAEYYNNSKFKKQIARNIYSKLVEKYSVKEISVKLDVTEQAIYKWQKNETAIISLENIFKIAIILNIDVFELIKETEL